MKSRFQSVYHSIVDWVHTGLVKLKNSHRKSLSVRYPYSIPIVDAPSSDSQTFGISSARVAYPLQNWQGVVSLFSRSSLGHIGYRFRLVFEIPMKAVAVLMLLVTVGVGNMWGETYALVKDASALSAGDKILIVSAGRSVTTKISGTKYTATYSDQAMNTTASSNHLLGDDVTISDSKITTTTAKEFTLGGTSTAWTIYNDDNTYLYTDERNKLLLGTSDKALTFTININSSDGVATITTTKSDFALDNNGSSTGSLVLRMYAASTNQSKASKYFVLYAASNTTSNYDVFIYKKVQTCTPLGQINGSINLTQ